AAQAAQARVAALEIHVKQIAEAAMQNSDSVDAQSPPRAVRHRLPAERASVTHKFGLAGHEGYITVGLYPNGQPGEIFIRMAKEGSTVAGLMDSFATAVSLALQHGVPLRVLCEKFAHTRFEPSGWSKNPEIGFAKSIMDYIFRWLHLRFLTGQQQSLFEGLRPNVAPMVALPDENGSSVARSALSRVEGSSSAEVSPSLLPAASSQHPAASPHAADRMKEFVDMGDAPSCHVCG